MPATVGPAPDRPSRPPAVKGAGWEARRVRASGTTIVLAAITVVAVYLARELFVAAMQPIGWVAAAVATALVIAPLVELPARVLPRGIAVLVTLVLATVVVVTVGTGLAVEVRDQLAELEEVLPAAAGELEARGEVLADLRFGSLVQDLVDQTSERLTPTPTVEDAAGTVPAYLVSAVLVVFFVLWAHRMFAALQRQISDERRRIRLADTTTLTVRMAQRYLLSVVVLAAAVAAVGGTLAWFAGLPTPLVLGVVLGAASLVPYVGIVLGGLPVLVLAAALEPALTTAVLAVAVVAVQAAHTVTMRRVVEARSLRVGPAMVVIAALVGSDLYGVGGTIVAIVAGAVAMAAVEAWNATSGPPEPSADDHLVDATPDA